MDAYDNNHDGRIDIRELAQLLPLEESFKLLFKFENQVDSSVEFMRVSSTMCHSIVELVHDPVLGGGGRVDHVTNSWRLFVTDLGEIRHRRKWLH